MHIVDVICILFRNAYVMYMSSLLLLSVYVHVIYILSGHICIMCTLYEVALDIYILSGHICIMCTLYEVVLDIFLPNRQYQCHPYIISSTLYIFYYVQLSFCTLSTQIHCHCHLHIVRTCTHHLLFISNTPCIPYYPQLSFCTLSTQMHIVHVICMLSTHEDVICLSSLIMHMYVHVISTAVICICTCHLHTIWAYMYYVHII